MTERMRGQLAAMQPAINQSGEQIGKVTASFGIAKLGHGEGADKLVECAGRNRCHATSGRLTMVSTGLTRSSSRNHSVFL
jgi:GGDEF domain-containing protein